MYELLPHWSFGKLINYILEPRLVFDINGGPHPSGIRFIGTVDYKDIRTLKSCHQEFRHIPPMRLLIESRFATDYIELQSAFIFFISCYYEQHQTILGVIPGLF